MSRPAPRPAANVTDAELAVLRALWERGASTIRELADRLYPDGGTSAYATVQKLLERLEGKGCADRQAAGRAHLFRATVERGELVARQLEETAARLCQGSMAPLLTHLVSHAELSQQEVGELRRLVERLDGERAPAVEGGER